MVFLTRRERELFDVLLRQSPAWIPNAAVAQRLFGYADLSERHHVRVQVYRVRVKLREHGAPWTIESHNEALRLVPVEASAHAA